LPERGAVRISQYERLDDLRQAKARAARRLEHLGNRLGSHELRVGDV
jgi:hypothetical protein